MKRHTAYLLIIVALVLPALFYSLTSKGTVEQKGVASPKMEAAPLQLINEPVTPLREETRKRPTIGSIVLTPQSSTVTDQIKAEVTSASGEMNAVVYSYQWKVNGRIIKEAQGNTLPSGLFKKGDVVNVSVVPHADEEAGHARESGYLYIQSAPPSLELKETKQKADESIELQLVGSDPDGDKITFALEEPLLEGMSIEKETGRIVWKPQKREKGAYTFKASATDTDGVKAIKLFQFALADN